MSEEVQTLTFTVLVDGSQAEKEFQTLSEASTALTQSIDGIKSTIPGGMQEAESYLSTMRSSVQSSFGRLGEIDSLLAPGSGSNTTSYDRDLLAHERSMLLQSIKATMHDMTEFSSVLGQMGKLFTGRGKIAGLAEAMPRLMQAANRAGAQSKLFSDLSSDQQLRASILTNGGSSALRSIGIEDMQGKQAQTNLRY